MTLEARRDFVEGVVPLSLWLARRLWHKGMALPEAITARTNIYRLTCLWDGTHHPAHPRDGRRDRRWEELLAQLELLFTRHADAEEPEALERQGLELLWPVLEPRLAVDVQSWPSLQNRPFGFFIYNDSPADRSIALHLANPFAPRSPFADPQARAAELSRLLDEATALSPCPLRVTCGSWLNTFPPFLQFFPHAWAASASEARPLGYHYGWWGQCIDRTGGFHRRNGEHLRRTGQFPYPCVHCSCALSELRWHLQENFDLKAGVRSL
jgi:hypothetical protein